VTTDDQQGEAHLYDKDDSLKQYKSPLELRKETNKEGCWDGEVEADGEGHRHFKTTRFFRRLRRKRRVGAVVAML
jgi:hypothetical protein